MAGNARHAGRSVTSRALAVLAAFDGQNRSLSLSQISRRAELSLTTTHRLLGELQGWGALKKRDDGNYVVGRRLWQLGLLAPVHSGLREVASPYLNDIHATTLATVHLAVLDNSRALYLDRIYGHSSVPVVSTVGSRLPLYATGVGKVLLAHAPSSVVAEVVDSLERITPYTIIQPGRLTRQLEAVRADGYAYTVEEMSLGACSVAVGIHNRDGDIVAAIGVVIPKLGRELSRHLSVLQVAARGIGRQLGASFRPAVTADSHA